MEDSYQYLDYIVNRDAFMICPEKIKESKAVRQRYFQKSREMLLKLGDESEFSCTSARYDRSSFKYEND